MAVRGDEVTARIESHIREAMERMITEIRSTVDDVREVVDQQFKAALQSIQADANSMSFRPRIKEAIQGLEDDIAAASVPAEPPIVSQPDAAPVKRAVQVIERGKTQVDILNGLLEQCLTFGSRAALFILKGESLAGWKGVGFSNRGGSDEAIKRFTATPGSVPELDRLLREERGVVWNGENLSSKLGAALPSSAVLIPMVIKDKVAAALYVDSVDNDSLAVPSLELLVFTTGLLIDTLATRKKTPSPSLTATDFAEPMTPTPVAAPARPPAPPPPLPKPRVAPLPTPEEVPGSSETIMAPGGFGAFSPAPSPSPAPAPPAPRRFELETEAPSRVTQHGLTPRPSPPPPAAAELAEKPSTQYIPPLGLARGGAFSTPQSDAAKKHDEAKRFARLLVSEIKLYNEAKVEQGRKNRDLYERLKEDIDRSRQMYDERISEDVRKASNYFYDELVRILANGDAEILGL